MAKRRSYKVFMGALEEVPIYERNKRGKNWLSVVSLDPSEPGGLRRERVPYAHGDYYYMVNGLRPGDVLEFGADYFTSKGGKRIPHRVYAIVISVSDTELVLELYGTPREAFEARNTMEFDSEDLSQTPTIVPSSTSGRYELDGRDITSGAVIELLVFDEWRKVRVEHLDGLEYCALVPQRKGQDERLAVPLRPGMVARWAK